MSYRLGVDVGGTFTDVLLINEATGEFHTAKVPSTPADSSLGVLHGIERVCAQAGVDPNAVTHVMHGTTVATNTMLTGTGARVGLVTTKGYAQVLQIARSFVPGGLGGWVVYQKSEPMAPLELTIEADERISARGEIIRPLDEAALCEALAGLREQAIEALTVCLINSFTNGVHEERIRALAAVVMPGVPVSISCEIMPEMQEYERTVTTVANSYVRPKVERYVRNLQREIVQRMPHARLRILRSDGGLAASEAAASCPVKLLMSGPAGGVTGALWVAASAGFPNLLTLDMGGTSTDVALVQNGEARVRRETTVGDVTVRSSSIDVRTVGAGGGSIAHVPALTRALRVGPQSAGAEPGPAAYGRGGLAATVTDASVVLGYLPTVARLGGDMPLALALATAAVQQVADALGLPLLRAAEGIYNIVNENMYGALRLVSVEQGYDPRDFALMAFGGAGPLHANALGRLTGAWPVIIPPGPGVLCAYGDATTAVREEMSRTYVRRFAAAPALELHTALSELAAAGARALDAEGVPRHEQRTRFEVDVRYHGQGLWLPIALDLAELVSGFPALTARFDAQHLQLFTFTLEVPHEFVNLRAIVQGVPPAIAAGQIAAGGPDPAAAAYATQRVRIEGVDADACVYDRPRLLAGNRIHGPAIVTQMDSTTLVLPAHVASVDPFGNLLIRPEA
ncbi:MAG: hydantoinase/oxoprolinase family protein [Gammaproteobacteria bacterium]|nr:hydantoinase/oxoprolinase family protein [Gammaproteobacteria bacterium]